MRTRAYSIKDKGNKMYNDFPTKLFSDLKNWVNSQINDVEPYEIFFLMACVSITELYELSDDQQGVDSLLRELIGRAKSYRSDRLH